MSSVFEEIANLDRPFVALKMGFNGKIYDWQARRPNALESDAIEAYYSDEYAGLIVKYTDPREDGTPNEYQQSKKLITALTRDNVIGQLMATRRQDVDRETLNKLDFNPAEEAAKALGMTPEEQEAHVKQRREEFTLAREAAVAEIRAEYENLDPEELVETLAQVNLNMKCLMEAAVARQAMYVYYTLHDGNGERICPTVASVRESFQTDTIRYFFENIQAAFALAVKQDLPFVSPDESEPNKPPSSASTSAQETTPSILGGRRTRRRRRSSKPSSMPQDGTQSKKD